MAKLGFFCLLLFCVSWAEAKSLQLEFYTEAFLEPGTTVKEEVVGGLSGLLWDGTKLLAVSDDRGKFGPPRFYELNLKWTNEKTAKAKLEATGVHHFSKIPSGWILDLEGLALLPHGDLLTATEGDNNKKPRAWPHVFVTSSSGEFKYDVALPDKFLPEPIGLQKKGVENNRAFEGLTVDSAGQRFFTINETPLVSDQGKEEGEAWLRLVEVGFGKTPDSFKVKGEYAYKLSRAAKNEAGIEVFRGVSELLYAQENKLLVLERGVRLGKAGIQNSGGLYLVDTTGASDVSGVASLPAGKATALKKDRLVDFEEILKNQSGANFEGLAWGPPLPDGRKTLLVISDNNFSLKEKTTLLVFAVKEVE